MLVRVKVPLSPIKNKRKYESEYRCMNKENKSYRT